MITVGFKNAIQCNGVGMNFFSNFKTVLFWAVGVLFSANVWALNAPSALSAVAASSSQINLSWQDNATNESGYIIQRSLSSGSGFTEIARAAANSKSFSNTGLAAATYYYRVRSYRNRLSGSVVYSSYSNIASATVGSVVVNPPPEPTPTPVPPPTSSTLFYDDFSGLAADGGCIADSQNFGLWHSVFAGYGCNSIVNLPEGQAVSLKPMVSTSSGETHAGLVVGPSFSGDYIFETILKNQQQLRTGTAPNAWEVAWAFWNYTDNVHFYYFVVKPNGWELGKGDPAYAGAQRFLSSGSSPTFAIGQWHNIKITQKSNVITVAVNGAVLTTFTDNERPYLSGRIGLYTEDAHVYFKSAKVSAAP